jgi:hypothetical protein
VRWPQSLLGRVCVSRLSSGQSPASRASSQLDKKTLFPSPVGNAPSSPMFTMMGMNVSHRSLGLGRQLYPFLRVAFVSLEAVRTGGSVITINNQVFASPRGRVVYNNHPPPWHHQQGQNGNGNNFAGGGGGRGAFQWAAAASAAAPAVADHQQQRNAMSVNDEHEAEMHRQRNRSASRARKQWVR